MNQYRVLLNGQNFLLNFDGKIQKTGFYITRNVKAESVEDAEQKATELIKNDEWLKNNILNDRNDSPTIYIDEIGVAEKGAKNLKNLGFSFYLEENELS